ATRHWRADYRPQRTRNAGYLRPRLYPQRRRSHRRRQWQRHPRQPARARRLPGRGFPPMKQTLRLNTSQRLTMTPALQQAIRMLQLPTLDLKTEIRDALESNLMLEVEEPEPAASPPSNEDTAPADIPDHLPLDAHWDDIYANGSAPAPAAANGTDDWRSYKQNNLTAAPDLHAHLTW